MVVVDRGVADTAATGRVMVRVADVDAHHAHAVAAGAAVVSAPTTYPFGEIGCHEEGIVTRGAGGPRW